MNVLHYDIKGKFDKSERLRKLFSIVLNEKNEIVSFASASKTPFNCVDVSSIIFYLDSSYFFELTKGAAEPLKDFHIGGGFRMVLSKKQTNTEANINQQNNIILWKMIYKEYMRSEAFITDKEVRLFGSRIYTEEQMRGFFECDLYFKKGLETVTSFVNNISAVVNYINTNHIQGTDPKGFQKPLGSNYPNHWNYDFEQKLEPSQMPKYWEHLRNLGLMPVKNNRGVTTHWEKSVISHQ